MKAQASIVIRMEDGRTLFLLTDDVQEVRVKNHTEPVSDPMSGMDTIQLTGGKSLTIAYKGPGPVWLEQPGSVGSGKF